MADEYAMLEGTPYSRYAIPVEYPPSRSYNSRWGYSHPRIEVLDEWFRQHTPAYHALLADMRRHVAALRDVPLEFDEQRLPEPAWFGVPYSPFDAVALYTILTQARPKCYLEIGSGATTCFAHRAIRDAGLATSIISIDPEPRAKIDEICDEIIREGLETCDVAIFDQLEANDIVFFDGSHRSFPNSDVTVFMVDVLPRLKPGVIVHIHDIMLPWDYPQSFLNWYWNEQYLLAVYMMGNKYRLDPLFPTHFVCHDAEFDAALAEPFIDFGDRNDAWRGGGAMWFTHIGAPEPELRHGGMRGLMQRAAKVVFG